MFLFSSLFVAVGHSLSFLQPFPISFFFVFDLNFFVFPGSRRSLIKKKAAEGELWLRRTMEAGGDPQELPSKRRRVWQDDEGKKILTLNVLVLIQRSSRESCGRCLICPLWSNWSAAAKVVWTEKNELSSGRNFYLHLWNANPRKKNSAMSSNRKWRTPLIQQALGARLITSITEGQSSILVEHTEMPPMQRIFMS